MVSRLNEGAYLFVTVVQSTCSKGSTIMDHKIKQNGCQKFVMSSPVLKISSIRNQDPATVA